MRITGGKARGIAIKAPKGDITRPATDRMREAIFSSLGPRVEGSRVVDLFAGTGAYGLEAISRGALTATFYETNREALACLKQNRQAVLKSCGLENSTTSILPRDVYAADIVSEKAELIFIDPPYDEIENRLEQIFQKADQCTTVDGYVILELPGNVELEPEGWQLVRRFGRQKRDTPNAAIFERRG
ncbi:MAG: 16S rRNA (guanine966-N2)-methyltransferase [Zhongshania aliphaticivorans]|jgi:16S rRNA (guanine966-N2)-methyltransferase